MLIKNITSTGQAVPLTPREALIPALTIALSKQNSSEYIYWLDNSALSVDAFSDHVKDDGQYEAFAEGTLLCGKTKVANDEFFASKPYTFKINYFSSKDEIGAPHVEIRSFDFSLAETNPANMVGFVDTTQAVVEKSSGGKISSKSLK